MNQLFCNLLHEINEDPDSYSLMSNLAESDALRQLSDEELKNIDMALCRIIGECPEGKLLFRGQNIKYEANLLDVDLKESEKEYNIEHYLFPKIFYFGEKAKCYYLGKKQNIYQALSSSQNCEILFNSLKNKLKYADEKFHQKNLPLCAFFEDDKNLKLFIEKIKDKAKLYSYYKAISHTLESDETSYLISATEDIKQALTFAGEKEPIIIGFIKPLVDIKKGNYQFSQKNYNHEINEIEEELSDLGLPIISGEWPFESERENVVTGCLLPHLIWFVIDITSKRIIINPHLITRGFKDKSIFIDIDQEDFDMRIATTTYQGYVVYDWTYNYYKLDNNVK